MRVLLPVTHFLGGDLLWRGCYGLKMFACWLRTWVVLLIVERQPDLSGSGWLGCELYCDIKMER